ncbi:hypothetical protein TNCV_965951 [Trichonephila clavipes]|nr:hypothetical protein TNCV_965951 [Trichonephila clavipes]
MNKASATWRLRKVKPGRSKHKRTSERVKWRKKLDENQGRRSASRTRASLWVKAKLRYAAPPLAFNDNGTQILDSTAQQPRNRNHGRLANTAASYQVSEI